MFASQAVSGKNLALWKLRVALADSLGLSAMLFGATLGTEAKRKTRAPTSEHQNIFPYFEPKEKSERSPIKKKKKRTKNRVLNCPFYLHTIVNCRKLAQ